MKEESRKVPLISPINGKPICVSRESNVCPHCGAELNLHFWVDEAFKNKVYGIPELLREMQKWVPISVAKDVIGDEQKTKHAFEEQLAYVTELNNKLGEKLSELEQEINYHKKMKTHLYEVMEEAQSKRIDAEKKVKHLEKKVEDIQKIVKQHTDVFEQAYNLRLYTVLRKIQKILENNSRKNVGEVKK